MDSNIKQLIKIVANDKIIGLAKSLDLTEKFIYNSFDSIEWDPLTVKKIKESYMIGKFEFLSFDKEQCKPFPRFFNIQFYENDKLINTIENIYLISLINEKQSDLDNFLFECDFINETIIGWNIVEFSNQNAKEYKNYYNEQNKSKQIFTDEFKKKLDLGKYTRWVADLSSDELQGLFSIIGEIKIRSKRVFDQSKIDEICHGLDEDKIQGSAERMKCGLSLLLRFLSGQNKTLDEVQKEIIESVK